MPTTRRGVVHVLQLLPRAQVPSRDARHGRWNHRPDLERRDLLEAA